MNNILRRPLSVFLILTMLMTMPLSAFGTEGASDVSDVIDFSDEAVWTSIGALPQLSRSDEQVYTDKAYSAKLSGNSDNWTGFIDLASIGFTTDWSGYDTLKIRYYTSDVNYVPAIYLSTYKGWVTSTGLVMKGTETLAENQGAYRLKASLYSSKKPAEAGWVTAEFDLANDLVLYPPNTTNIAMGNIPYLFIPTHQLKQYWNNDSDTMTDISSADKYIDSIWLEKDPVILTTLDFNTDEAWAGVNACSGTKTLAESTSVAAEGKTRSAQLIKNNIYNQNGGWIDLARASFATDWSDYTGIEITFHTNTAGVLPAIYLSTQQSWVSSSDTTNGSYKLTKAAADKAKDVTAGWNTVTYEIGENSVFSANKGASWAKVPYLQFPSGNLNEYWNKIGTGNIPSGGSGASTYASGVEIHIDTVSLVKNEQGDDDGDDDDEPVTPPEPELPSYTGPEVEGDSVIAFFRTADDITAFGSRFSQNTDAGYTYGKYPMSAKCQMNNNTWSGFYDIKASGGETDWSKYEYLNIRYRSQAEGYSILFAGLKNNKRGTYDDNENPWQFVLLDSFTEWTTVSVPISTGFTAWPASSGFGMDNINYLQIVNDTSKGAVGGAECVFYFDKIWLSNTPPPSEMSAIQPSYYPANGFEAMPTDGAQFAVMSEGEAVYTYDSEFKVTAHGAETSLVPELNPQNGGYVVSFAEKLEYNTDYTVTGTISLVDQYDRYIELPVDYSFRTVTEGLSFSSVEFTHGGSKITALPSGGTVTANVRLTNLTSDDTEIMLHMALYDADGRIVSMPESASVNLKSGDADLALELSLSSDTYSDMTLSAWITDSELVPLQHSFASIGSLAKYPFASEPGSGSGIEIDGKADIDVINITGTAGETNKYILASAVASDGSVKAVLPFYADADGSISAKLYMSDSADTGSYTVKAVSCGGAGDNFSIAYIGKADRDSVFASVKAAASASDVSKALSPFAEVYYGYDDDELSTVSLALYENAKEASAYSDMFKIGEAALAALAKVNAANWNSFYAIASDSENVTLLMGKDSNWSYYSSLSENIRNLLAKDIMDSAPFADTAALRSAIKKACDSYKDGDIDTPKKDDGSSGKKPSSGGGGGSANVGGYSGSVVTGGVAAPGNTVQPADTSVFTDITNHWSRSYVELLYNKGIVSYAANGLFRPDDKITREEFVKLIVLAMGFAVDSGNDGRFSDVPSDAWYSDFVYTAVNNGIITGMGDGRFGTGENIIRQDASVICYRALNRVYVNADTSSLFTDDSLIGDYAKDAVYQLRTLGIISGFEDNTFRPDGNLLRAEAAKIIAEFINTTQGE